MHTKIKMIGDYAPFRAAKNVEAVRLECPFNQPQGPRDEHGAQTREPEKPDSYDIALGNGGADTVLHGGPSKF